MPIRLLVSDIDGTLVNKAKALTPATIDAVGRLRAAGVQFTVISARPMSGLRPLLAPLGLEGDVAAFNGGLIARADGGVAYHATIDAEAARTAMRLAHGAAVDIWVFADDRWYASDPHGPHTDSERRASAQEPVTHADMDALLDRADKITFVSDDEAALRALYDTIHAAVGDRATVVQSQTYYLDVTATTANKGDGIAALAKALGVDLAQTAAIGDQANDLPMLRRAGLAIAMGNAPDAVKAVAGHTTRTNEEDGVAHAIDTLILSSGEPA